MSNRKTIALNTLSQIMGKTITSGTTFIISILIAGSLGSSGYGDFTKITTFVALFYLFADFGLNAAYLELSENKKALNNLFSLRVAFGILLMFICVSMLAFLPGTSIQGYTPYVKFGIIVFSVSILLQSLITSSNAFFQKSFRYDLSSYALSVGAIFTLCIIFAFPYFGITGVLSSIFAFLAGSGITVITSLFFVNKFAHGLSFSWDIPVMRKMLSIAFPLGLTLLCNVVYFHADSILLTFFRSTSEVGVYGFAYKIFELPLSIPTFFMNAVFPLLLISRKSDNTPAFLRQVRQSAVLLFLLALVLVVLGYLTAPFISLVNADFLKSVLPLRILLLSLPVFFLTSLTMWVLIALKKRSQLFIIYFVSMVVNIGSNMLLIPKYGYMASAWITVVSEILVLMLSLLIIKKSIKGDMQKSSVPHHSFSPNG